MVSVENRRARVILYGFLAFVVLDVALGAAPPQFEFLRWPRIVLFVTLALIFGWGIYRNLRVARTWLIYYTAITLIVFPFLALSWVLGDHEIHKWWSNPYKVIYFFYCIIVFVYLRSLEGRTLFSRSFADVHKST
jgi:hypothetical protein